MLRTIYIGGALEYACKFWASHLVKVPSSDNNFEKIGRALEKFFTTNFLFWVEVLVLTGNLDIGIYALNDVEQWYILVSNMEGIYWSSYSYLLRQEIPASGQGMQGF